MFEEANKPKAFHGDGVDGFSVDTPEKRLDQIKALLISTQHNLDKISKVVEKIQQDQKKDMYKKMPGIEGAFDGVYLVSDSGEKYEVPSNYAAKSRLVFGDRLKIVEEDGKKVFKQITKLDRKEVKGVLSKKEGKWHLLADSGTYRISDTAAEFNRVELNEEAIGLIPADQPNVPFAALDVVIRKETPKPENNPAPKPVINSNKTKPVEVKKVEVVKKPQTTPAKVFQRPVIKKEEIKKPAPIIKKSVKIDDNTPKEYVANLLEDDDLR